MGTKKFVLMILCLLILAAAVLADTSCPTKEEYRAMVKEATNDYFISPSHEKLMKLQDMLKIYATHDFTKCLGSEGEVFVGSESVQTCSDGTVYGGCSVDKPLYCDNGELVELCSICGCGSGYGCQGDGSCAVLTCNDGTLYDQCSVTKPLFCEDGNLVNKCGVCGCYENQVCKADETCVIRPEIEALLLMMQAEKLLAEKALETARNTPIKYPPKYEETVKQEIQKSEQWLNTANLEVEQGNYEEAVDAYKESWEHSQEAIKLANTPCPPNCVGKCGGASDGCGGSCNAACPSGQVCTNGICTPKPKEEKPLVVKIVETVVKVIVTVVKAVVKFFRRLFRW